MMLLKSKTMFSVLAAINNTGDEIFSFEDYFRLQGGFQSLIQNSGSNMNLSGNELSLLVPDKNIYKKDAGIAALTLAYQPNKKLKLNTYVLFSGNKSHSESLKKMDYIVPSDSIFSSQEYFRSQSKTQLLSGYVKLNYQFSKTLEIYYKGNAGLSKIKKENDIFNKAFYQNIEALENRYSLTPSTKQNFGLMKLFGKHLFVADILIDYHHNNYNLDVVSDSLLLPLPILSYNLPYDVQQEEYSRIFRNTMDAAFLFKIKKSYFLKFGVHVDLNRQKYLSNLYQKKDNHEKELLSIDNLKNDYIVNMNDYNTDLIFSKSKGLFKFKAGAIAHLYTFNHPTLKPNNTFNITPYLNISISTKKHNVNITYEEKTAMYAAKDFATGFIMSNYQSYYYNSQLKDLYAIAHDISFSYNFSNFFSGTNILLTINYNREKNSLTTNYIQNDILSEYQNYSSEKQRESFFSKIFFEQGIGNIPWKFSINTSYSYFVNYNQYSGIENKMNVNRLNAKLDLKSHYKKIFNMEAEAGFEYIDNLFSLQDKINKQLVQNYALLLTFNFSKQWYFETSFEYAINDVSDNKLYFYYLNTMLRYSMLKNKLSVELFGRNLLNLEKQKWMSLSSNGAYVIKSYFQTIPGCLLLKLNYKI